MKLVKFIFYIAIQRHGSGSQIIFLQVVLFGFSVHIFRWLSYQAKTLGLCQTSGSRGGVMQPLFFSHYQLTNLSIPSNPPLSIFVPSLEVWAGPALDFLLSSGATLRCGGCGIAQFVSFRKHKLVLTPHFRIFLHFPHYFA